MIYIQLIFFFMVSLSFAIEITNYQILTNLSFSKDGKRYYALRSFVENEKEKILAVNVDTLETKVFLKSDISFKQKRYINSKYEKLLKKSLENKESLQNGGIKNGNIKGLFLTVDLCPSSKKDPFEKNVIKMFMKKGYKNIAFSVTGRWLKKNKKYFLWIKSQEKNKKLNVVWINHTFTHFYSKKLPLKENFLLKKGTNLFFEITQVEKILLENGEIPSVFIRYPGLVANQKIREEVANKFGLIALGSDAWLAKGERPKDGSIILIHGNKNEPLGIKLFLKLLKQKRKFLPLYDMKP